MDTTAFAFHRKLKMHHFLTCDLELRRPLPSGDAGNVFSFVCLFLFFFLPCECSKHNSLCTKNPLARHKCCCAVRLYLIVIYCPNDFHISCYCSRFLLECSRPAAVHCVCALNVAGFIYVMFFNWACCDLFMPPRICLAFVSRVSAFLFS